MKLQWPFKPEDYLEEGEDYLEKNGVSFSIPLHKIPRLWRKLKRKWQRHLRREQDRARNR